MDFTRLGIVRAGFLKLETMEKLKVVEVKKEAIIFDNGFVLESNHDQDCCENHWLDFSNLALKDFEGLEFNLSTDSFFNRVPGYGIELLPVKGWPIRIPGYGSNNGYYSSDLELVLSNKEWIKKYDITECQEINV